MAKDLDEVRGELYEAFNKAMEGVRAWSYHGQSADRINATANSVRAASEAADAIAHIERQLEESRSATSLKLPGK